MKKFSKLHAELLGPVVKGRPRFFLFNPKTGEIRKVIERDNLVLYSGADILAKLLSGASEYAVKTMYLEFANTASPVVPTFDRTGGLAYYNGLTGDYDFLRVPLQVSPALSSSDAVYANNIVSFYGISEGAVGVLGKAFSYAAGSNVFGAALVASPNPGEQSEDVVFSRVYTGIGKIPKEAGFEIGVLWPVQFN